MPRATLDTQKVIDEAATIADAEGLDAVTLTRVADRLGVRQPALYRHVEGYDDLIRSLGLRGRELLAARLSTAAQGVAGPDVVRALVVSGMNIAHHALPKFHVGIYQQIFKKSRIKNLAFFDQAKF